MSAVPSSMKAVVLTEIGDLDKLQYTENHPVPKLAPGQLLVRNEIAGINFADIYVRTGHYPAGGSFPVVCGLEGVGIVKAIADPDPLGFQIGDRVLWQGFGGYAEYSTVSGDKAVKVRPEITSEDAVGSYITGITALSLIDQAYTPAAGETVLVHAAAGGVGLMLCQLLKHRGVNVIGTVSNENKFGIVKKSGAQHVITYKTNTGKDWIAQVNDLTDGKGVNAVFDSVGEDTWQGSFEVTKSRGKVVFLGMSSGPIPPVDLWTYSRKRNVSILLSTLANSIDTRELLEEYYGKIQDLIVQGEIEVTKHKTYDLKDAAKAQEDLGGRGTIGKLCLRI